MGDQTLTPLIGVPADLRQIDGMPFHAVGDKYVRAVLTAAHGLPVVVPAFGALYDIPALVQALDGLMLTGSPSNVHPSHYGTPASPEAEPYDRPRDATTLPIIRAALDHAVPLLAICRGFQELNVALGGTLHARVHDLPDRMDHRGPKHDDLDVRYGPRHSVAVTPGGSLERLAEAAELTVNSLHWQAIDRLAEGLRVEAVADDGTIEAVSVPRARNFALAVQWHPEYKVLENDFSTTLFTAFGQAAQARAQARRQGTLKPAGAESLFA
jgi:putative glutamine amidotransferase